MASVACWLRSFDEHPFRDFWYHPVGGYWQHPDLGPDCRITDEDIFSWSMDQFREVASAVSRALEQLATIQ